jgi:hypothetical protein
VLASSLPREILSADSLTIIPTRGAKHLPTAGRDGLVTILA